MNTKDQELFYIGAAVYLGLDSDEVNAALVRYDLTTEGNTAAECKEGIRKQYPIRVATMMGQHWPRYLIHNRLTQAPPNVDIYDIRNIVAIQLNKAENGLPTDVFFIDYETEVVVLTTGGYIIMKREELNIRFDNLTGGANVDTHYQR